MYTGQFEIIRPVRAELLLINANTQFRSRHMPKVCGHCLSHFNLNFSSTTSALKVSQGRSDGVVLPGEGTVPLTAVCGDSRLQPTGHKDSAWPDEYSCSLQWSQWSAPISSRLWTNDIFRNRIICSYISSESLQLQNNMCTEIRS